MKSITKNQLRRNIRPLTNYKLDFFKFTITFLSFILPFLFLGYVVFSEFNNLFPFKWLK
jgi:hypothetical protein